MLVVLAVRTRDSATPAPTERHGVITRRRAALVVGAVLPRGTKVRSATLDGRRVQPVLTTTSRGLEVTVRAPGRTGSTRLVVRTR